MDVARIAPYALLGLMALLAVAGEVAAIKNPLDIVQCVWEGPNGECG